MKNLERPVRVTHLLCSGDDETDKMRYAKKFNAKGEAAIHLVWEEWFWDSLRFGGQSDLCPSSYPSLSSSIPHQLHLYSAFSTSPWVRS